MKVVACIGASWCLLVPNVLLSFMFPGTVPGPFKRGLGKLSWTSFRDINWIAIFGMPAIFLLGGIVRFCMVKCTRVVDAFGNVRWVMPWSYEVGDFWECDYLRHLMPSLSDDKRILLFSSNCVTTDDAIATVKKYDIHVLVHISDEWSNGPGGVDEWKQARAADFDRLYSQVPLVIRQYVYFPVEPKPHVHYMPLGYAKGMFDALPSSNDDLLSSSKRYLVWSFAGKREKGDRPQMLDEMKKNLQPFQIADGISARAMRQMYENSQFVPIGIGNVGHDCFRIYEASACGAIPVICCDAELRTRTFCKMEALAGKLPWVFATTWAEATQTCAAIIANGDNDLDARQRQVRTWLYRAFERTQSLFLDSNEANITVAPQV